MKLSTKIVSSIVVLVLFICLGIGITAIVISYSVVSNVAKESLMTQAEIGKRLVEAEIESELLLLQDIASRSELKSLDWKLQHANLVDIIEQTGYLDFGVMHSNGTTHYFMGN